MQWKDNVTIKEFLERADYWSHSEARSQIIMIVTSHFGWRQRGKEKEGRLRRRGEGQSKRERKGRVRFTEGNSENRNSPRKVEDLRKGIMCH